MLVAEDGTGLEAADVYADLDHAEAFHTERGTIDALRPFVDAGTAAGGLLQATAMLDSSYAWRNMILTTDQGLKLPRQDFFDGDGRL